MASLASCSAFLAVSSAVSICSVMSLALSICRRSREVLGFIESVSKDIRGWKPLLRKKGVICLAEDWALLSANSAIASHSVLTGRLFGLRDRPGRPAWAGRG